MGPIRGTVGGSARTKIGRFGEEIDLKTLEVSGPPFARDSSRPGPERATGARGN